MTTHHDEEHTSLTAAVAALGDDAGRAPSIDEIAAQRRREIQGKALDVISAALVCDWPPTGHERDLACEVIEDLERAGLMIVQRRPE